MKAEPERHHIWCNIQHGDVATCPMCVGLKADYPEDGLTPDELMKRHFPNNRKVSD